ncbi:hypothetical protein SPRG_14944 [Saprolegnia parasitica CBS 223.65]|uniref:PDZ domain-containing protein n=1 Tax=Saprolegnia parasitica (strain CBS 223.65) TaxID=695850 RepID=A0A067BMX8_SAPPC|nr:hypothetical protein SPRG_14944 [Saprolegnia parasitica CBS 223.65]KDO19844.1 hypothetical protein SPRG_14944 [Saprolegnia parasitica CBS 223.65]|eukprot:XP_012209456.1 hypothetical protein SPRG_14944 [Saprolegnia parasitica CBS 223.65]
MGHGLRLICALLLHVLLDAYVYFEAPFAAERYVLSPVLLDESEVHLVLHRIEPGTETGDDDANDFRVQTTDRLVGVDNATMSTLSFEAIADTPPNSTFIVPLLTELDEPEVEDAVRLEGFLQLHVMAPTTLSVRLRSGALGAVPAAACLAPNTSTCAMHASFDRAQRRMVLRLAFFQSKDASLERGDTFLAVDGVEISLAPLDEIVEGVMKPGASPVAVPLVDTRDGHSNVLSGFLRLTRLEPRTLLFEPTLTRRRDALVRLIAADNAVAAYNGMPVTHAAYRRFVTTDPIGAARVMGLESDGMPSSEMPRPSKLRAIETQEGAGGDDEEHRNAPTPSVTAPTPAPTPVPLPPVVPMESVPPPPPSPDDSIYSVTFAVETRLGIMWNASVTDKTLVEDVISHSPAAAVGLIKPKDHLLSINAHNVSRVGPEELMTPFKAAGWPKTLTFLRYKEPPRAPAPVVNTTVAPAPDTRFPLLAHVNISAARQNGCDFYYVVEFNVVGNPPQPIGIGWDMDVGNQSVVKLIVTNSSAERVKVLGLGDHLVDINGINVSMLPPRRMAQTFESVRNPRRLVLYAPPCAIATTTVVVAPSGQVVLDPVHVFWATVPLSTVASHRQDGHVVRYAVRIAALCAIGIEWDRDAPFGAIVQHVQPQSLLANRTDVTILPLETLVGIDVLNVTTLPLADIKVLFETSPFPKQLIFETSPPSNVTTAAPLRMRHTLTFTDDAMLMNWSLPLVVAEWSASHRIQENVVVVIASPSTACSALQTTTPGTLVLAFRGVCAFTEKAKRVAAASRTGLLLINDQTKGPLAFPRTTTTTVEPTSIPVAMMAKNDGELLYALLQARPTAGAAVWVQEPAASPLGPWPASEPSPTTMRVSVGSHERVMTVNHTGPHPFVNATVAPLQLVHAYPLQTACHRDDLNVRGRGAVVVVKRGKCNIIHKAMTVQKMGAKGILVVNDDEDHPIYLEPPREIHIWILVINATDGHWLEDAFRASHDTTPVPVFLRLQH